MATTKSSMSATRDTASQTMAKHVGAPQAVTMALVALLAAAGLALALAASGGNDTATATKSVGAPASAPVVQRVQPPDVNGPGARP